MIVRRNVMRLINALRVGAFCVEVLSDGLRETDGRGRLGALINARLHRNGTRFAY